MLNCARHSTVRMLVYREDAQEEGAMGREALVVWREVSLIQREKAVAHREEEVTGREDAVRVREELVEERARGLEEGQVQCFPPLDGIHLHVCNDKRTAIMRVQISQPSVVINGEQLCEYKAPVDWCKARGPTLREVLACHEEVFKNKVGLANGP